MFGDDTPITEIDPTYPLCAEKDGSHIRVWLDTLGSIPVKLLARHSGVVDADGTPRNAYDWRKQQPAAGGGWEDSTDVVSGTYQEWPAFPADDGAYDDVAPLDLSGRVLFLYPGVVDSVSDADGGHGLEWWFYGSDFGQGRRVMAKVQEVSTGGPYTSYGSPIILQKWDTTLHLWTNMYTPPSPTSNGKRIRDPNLVDFIKNEICEATLLETGIIAAGVSLYARTGLAGIQTSGVDVNGSHATHKLTLNDPLYWNSAAPTEQIDIVVSGGPIGGFVGSWGGVLAGTLTGTETNNHYLNYQWARQGSTGFTTLGTNTLKIGINFPDVNTPGTTWAAAEYVKIVADLTSLHIGFSEFSTNQILSLANGPTNADVGWGVGGTVDQFNSWNVNAHHITYSYATTGCEFGIFGLLRVYGTGGTGNPAFYAAYGDDFILNSPHADIRSGNGAYPFGGGTGVYLSLAGSDIFLGGNVHISGSLSVGGGLTLGTPLTLGNGGTGSATLTTAGAYPVIFGGLFVESTGLRGVGGAAGPIEISAGGGDWVRLGMDLV